MQFPDTIQGQSTGRPEQVRTVDWIPLFVYPDLVFVVVCGRDECCLSVRFTCLLCVCTVLCSICGENHRSHQNVRIEIQVSLRKKTLHMIMNDINRNVNLQKKTNITMSHYAYSLYSIKR